jgi:curved DNA-binding protein
LKYHPDKTQGDKASEEKFKKISEAYAVLSDPEKKNQYDTYGSADFQQRFSQEDIFRNFDLGDILKEFGFGGSRGGGFSQNFGRGGQRGGFSGSGVNPFFQNMGGGFGQQQPRTKGKDLEYEIPLTLDEIIKGTKKTITITQGGSTKAIEVNIPKGLVPGKKIRLAGKGEASPNGGPAGNLYIKSSPVPSDGYTLEGNDVLLSTQVLLTQALLGDTIEAVTPDGTAIHLKIPAGTNHKAKMRVPGHGIPQMKGNGCGDLFVVINITMPKKLTAKQEELIQELQKTGI